MRIFEMFRIGKVINLLEYPLRTQDTETGRCLDVKQMPHMGCKHTAVNELLSHRTHLLSAYRNSLAQMALAAHTSART